MKQRASHRSVLTDPSSANFEAERASAAVAAVSRPAWVIDPQGARMLAINEPGRAAWGLAVSALCPFALDAATPALSVLAASDVAARRAPLVFWTNRGACRWHCSHQRIGEGRSVLVIAEPFGVGIETGQPAVNAGALPEAGSELCDRRDVGPVRVSADIRSLAHELRTPIASIIGLAEMIEREQLGPIGEPRYRGYAASIREGAQTALAIVATALDPSSNSAEALLDLDDFVELDVADLVRRAARQFEALAGAAGISLEVSTEARLPRLVASRRALMQVLSNLTGNAMKFTAPGGVVRLLAKHGSQSGELLLVVEDTGLGMTASELRLLLGNAGTEQDRGGGPRPGVGFALTRRLCRAVGGELDVSSARGEGTAVSIRFPAEKTLPAPATSETS